MVDHKLSSFGSVTLAAETLPADIRGRHLGLTPTMSSVKIGRFWVNRTVDHEFMSVLSYPRFLLSVFVVYYFLLSYLVWYVFCFFVFSVLVVLV